MGTFRVIHYLFCALTIRLSNLSRRTWTFTSTDLTRLCAGRGFGIPRIILEATTDSPPRLHNSRLTTLSCLCFLPDLQVPALPSLQSSVLSSGAVLARKSPTSCMNRSRSSQCDICAPPSVTHLTLGIVLNQGYMLRFVTSSVLPLTRSVSTPIL